MISLRYHDNCEVSSWISDRKNFPPDFIFFCLLQINERYILLTYFINKWRNLLSGPKKNSQR